MASGRLRALLLCGFLLPCVLVGADPSTPLKAGVSPAAQGGLQSRSMDARHSRRPPCWSSRGGSRRGRAGTLGPRRSNNKGRGQFRPRRHSASTEPAGGKREVSPGGHPAGAPSAGRASQPCTGLRASGKAETRRLESSGESSSSTRSSRTFLRRLPSSSPCCLSKTDPFLKPSPSSSESGRPALLRTKWPSISAARTC